MGLKVEMVRFKEGMRDRAEIGEVNVGIGWELTVGWAIGVIEEVSVSRSEYLLLYNSKDNGGYRKLAVIGCISKYCNGSIYISYMWTV